MKNHKYYKNISDFNYLFWNWDLFGFENWCFIDLRILDENSWQFLIEEFLFFFHMLIGITLTTKKLTFNIMSKNLEQTIHS